ncbi:DUF5709 domain-containing protein [Streptomyces fradiae]|uniref:DUF5709 domain-containing protein n=1 Tax=Streptomyces fradiae TaxID=1906 RepID=UPI0035134AE9
MTASQNSAKDQAEAPAEAHTTRTGPRGDDVYQPAGSDASNRPSDPFDPENALEVEPTEAPEEPGYSPPDRPVAVTRSGTTAGEQRAGASLDERLAKERPDVTPDDANGIGDLPGGEGEPLDAESGAVRAGRIVAADPSVPGRVAARDVGPDDGAAAAEEAAMHRDMAVDGGADRPPPPPAD